MSKLFFWNAWPNTHKHLFQAVSVLLGASIVCYLIGYFWSSRLVIQWETISKITTLPLILESWTYASIPLDISVNQFLITQIFEGSDLELTTWPAALLLLVLAFSLVLALSLAVDLSRFWFLVSQVVFIFVMVGFKLEQLLLFDRTDKAALILAFILYLPASYYFHAVKKDSSLQTRLLVFGILTAVFGGMVNFYSGVSHPFVYLVDYGIPIPMALTVIFILFTAHEIIYGILVLITRSNTPNSSNSFFHFFALSLIYLGNVLFLYLRNTRRITWDLYYVDAFWILIAAGIIGIWSLRQRGESFKNIMPVEPHALLGYLALASISFATIGYFFATANDPAVEALEDAIVIGHLTIGFVFLIYILFNFRDVLIENLKVYKVVYKPRKMPFFSMRIGGLIGTLGLFLLSNQYPLDQAITGYYNGIGDLHRLDNKPILAKEYYKLAAIYAQSNHRSNYAIATMAKEDHDFSDALAYFKQATIKQPTPFAFVNTARAYEEQGMFFKAMFTLKDGLKVFPGNPHILNNLSALYAKTDLLDSAYYYLQNVHGATDITKVGFTNQLSLLARSGVEMSLDSVVDNTSWSYPEVGTNLLLLANVQHQQIDQYLELPADTLLNPITFSWWYNYNLNHRSRNDSVQQVQIDHMLNLPENQLYADNLNFSKVLRLYYSGDVTAAFIAIRALQFRDTGKSGLYNDLLGQWSLQQHQPQLALDYFDRSIRAGYLPALWHRSLSLVALGQFEEALASWSTFVYRSETSPLEKMSEVMAFVNRESQPWDSLNDQQKAWHLQFKTPELSLATKKEMLEEIQDPFIYQNTEKWWWRVAIRKEPRSLKGILNTVKDQKDGFRELQLATVKRDYAAMELLISKYDNQEPDTRDWVNYARALLSQERKDSEVADNSHKILLRNPFFEPGILEASKYYGAKAEDEYRTYEVLLDALAVNQYSVPLLKAYGVECTRLNLDTYRRTTLETLQELIPASEFQSYMLGLLESERTLEEDYSGLDNEEGV